MRQPIFISSLAAILFSLFLNNDAFAWDNKITHRDLSSYAAQSSVLSKDKGDYLKNLGFDKGLLSVFRWDGSSTINIGYVSDWLREGAELEDEGSN